jgi:hypothetical protein
MKTCPLCCTTRRAARDQGEEEEGDHDHKDQALNAPGLRQPEGPHLERRRLDGPEAPFDQALLLIQAEGVLQGALRGGEVRAQAIEPIELRVLTQALTVELPAHLQALGPGADRDVQVGLHTGTGRGHFALDGGGVPIGRVAQAPSRLMGTGRNDKRFMISTSITCPVGTIRSWPAVTRAAMVSAPPRRRRYG